MNLVGIEEFHLISGNHFLRIICSFYDCEVESNRLISYETGPGLAHLLSNCVGLLSVFLPAQFMCQLPKPLTQA